MTGRRSSSGGVQAAGSAATCSPERMSLTSLPNQTYGIPRRSAYRICLPNFAAEGETSHAMPRRRRPAAIRSESARLSSSPPNARLLPEPGARRTADGDSPMELLKEPRRRLDGGATDDHSAFSSA